MRVSEAHARLERSDDAAQLHQAAVSLALRTRWLTVAGSKEQPTYMGIASAASQARRLSVL